MGKNIWGCERQLTCVVISHRSWPLGSAPSAVWSISPALCKGSLTPAQSQCTSEPKHENNTFKLPHTNCDCFAKIIWRGVASLHRWGFPWSAGEGSLWMLPRCCGSPARQSPARRPCPGPWARSPSPAALSPQYPLPGGEKEKKWKKGKTCVHCKEKKILALNVNLQLNAIPNESQQREHTAFLPPEALFPSHNTFSWMLCYTA